jgi:hydrogenase-1 operon protein HyaE
MMRSPLLQALIDEHQYSLLTEDSVDEFLQAHDDVVLFFSENPQHFPESNDVAVILPQLMAQFGDRLIPGVVAEAAERALHKRYGFNKWPALVFLRRGDYLGVITGMQNWTEFQAEFERILAASPGKAPEFAIPVVAQE